MRHPVVFRPEAEDDALEVRSWYESRRAGLGREFSDALQALLVRIVDNPSLYQRVHNETRRAVLSGFPYAVYFRIAEERVVVLAIHGRQHDSHWRDVSGS